MSEFEIVDRKLKGVRLTATVNDVECWIECYLHESNMTDKRFAVVERVNSAPSRPDDFTRFTTDDANEAEQRYAEVEARVKAAIAKVLG